MPSASARADFAERVLAIVAAHLERWEADPEAAWRGFVHEIAELGFGSIAYQLGPFAKHSPGLFAQAMERREKVADALPPLLEAAKRAGLLAADTDPERFLVGLAVLTRPLPDAVAARIPQQREWMVDVYLQGLRPGN
ncbi:SbtR family transcriptional regulator [Brachybacterium aquaticum]|uniref:Transcriptional regulator SbtR-like C-terminal domain-containing protein n=1 Tax=Brachybacterium aquaticum TaxID=1432564 RepID=A0A841AGB5_9MICO|nr:hypothetical protein [Brachybacterium aquaticum]MBB5832375.1 hypothetical protein [Brachybacterium aquaticum]